MRSVYAKITLWSFGTLVLSLFAFFAVTAVVSFQNAHRTNFMGRIQGAELAQAREAYESGGPEKLRVFVERLQHYLPGAHYLTDSQGKDLLTGEDRSAMLRAAVPEGSRPPRFGGPVQLVATSEDGRYRWIVEMGPPPVDFWGYLPYYVLILGAVALVCWLLAMNIASPLRALARTVDRFGAGDLAVRVNATRRDEIGELGRAFDRMAERIGTLLSAERRLLQDISHELRSPLARLSFAAELARTAEDRDAAAARLKKEIQRLTDLVGALIQVTRAEGDPSAAVLEGLQLDELVGEVVDDCRVEADARGCRLALRAPAPLEVSGDRELLRRAIENVVRNSIHYAPPESAVDVELDRAQHAARISVRDYGPGVPEEALPRIFQPFFRVDDSRDTSTGGVGLGLAIAMRAVGLHHGKVWAQNANPGLRVLIELPLA
ncbi:MAG TPA: ATP-binding protein [Verrucomicrobiae bacterium]|nr:ATP-binding protein [Verrucomicrobiae bacterium]